MSTVKKAVRKVAVSLGLIEQRKRSYVHPFNQRHALWFLYYRRLFDIIKDVDGDILECGVGRGKSLLLFAYLLKDEGKKRKIWGFDSFEGFPEPTVEDTSKRSTQLGDKSMHTIDGVTKFFLENGLDEEFVRTDITLIKGFFNESLHKYRGDGIALLHLDGDLYESYKDPLNMLYNKVKPGGVIMFDEYLNTAEHVKFPGAQKAIDEFFGDQVKDIKRDEVTGKYYFVKPR